MPILTGKDAAHILAQRAAQLEARDAGGDGGLKENTKIGIALGLICFFALLLSFYAVSNWRKPRAPPTADDMRNKDTLERWMDNITRTHTTAARTHDRNGSTRRESTSTLSTLTSQKGVSQRYEHEPSHPPLAYTGGARQ
ncbi:hypothetical protein M0805_000401 [Coniferiporia weirii]|nr:hypothetical protein M0805_000401 [Coniferiporia weirii]